MRVLVTGITGMLGKDVASKFLQLPEYEVFGISRNRNSQFKNALLFDLTDAELLKNNLDNIKPDLIIHCAASVNVDACEENKDYTNLLHIEATKVLANYSTNTKLVYISTDSVFDGESGNYSEQSPTTPHNYYAETKLLGEKEALLNPHSIIVRTNIYGFHNPRGASLVEWALNNLVEGNSIKGFDDVYFNPLYTKQLANSIIELLNKNFKGIINLGSNSFVSKYQFLCDLANVFELDKDLIEAVSVDEVNFKAKRPKNTTLNTDYYRNITGLPSPDYISGMKMLRHDFKLFQSNKA